MLIVSSHIVCQDTAEDNETLNLHVTALMTFQNGKLQDIHRQTLLNPKLVKLARVIQNGWGESHGELDADLLHSGYTDSTCTSPMASL